MKHGNQFGEPILILIAESVPRIVSEVGGTVECWIRGIQVHEIPRADLLQTNFEWLRRNLCKSQAPADCAQGGGGRDRWRLLPPIRHVEATLAVHPEYTVEASLVQVNEARSLGGGKSRSVVKIPHAVIVFF